MSYRYALKDLRLYIDDEENEQHKVIALQKPYLGENLDDILRFIEKRAEELVWIPNDQDSVVVHLQ